MEDSKDKTISEENSTHLDSTCDTNKISQDSLLKEELEKTLNEVENFKDIAKRAQADLINYKKRADDEKVEERFAVKSNILLSIITILDDFTLAMNMLPDTTESKTWLEGVKIIHRKIEILLETQMVTKIDAIGKQFEPWEFEAIQYKDTTDFEENTVIEVIKEGYKYNGQILRPAQVIVSKPPHNQDEKSQEESN